jgi:hypothetical protein
VALLTAVQLKLGVLVAIVPVGASSGAAPGADTTLKVTVRMAFVALLAASRAVTVTIVVPAATGTDAIDHELVPVAVPLAPRSVDHVTCVTPTLSLAVPLTAMVPLVAVKVPVPVGAVIAIAGAVVSAAAGTVMLTPALQVLPAVFVVRIHQVAAPGASAMPGLTVQVPVPDPHPAAAAV